MAAGKENVFAKWIGDVMREHFYPTDQLSILRWEVSGQGTTSKLVIRFFFPRTDIYKVSQWESSGEATPKVNDSSDR